MITSDLNPDRSTQYRDTDPEKLRDQLNENWRQLRLLRTAVADRDTIIGTLHESVRLRDQAVKALKTRVKITSKLWPLVYAAVGGACAKGLELLVVHTLFGAVK